MDKIKELALELADFLKFDVLRQSLPKTDRFSLDKLNLDFEIYHNPGEGYWVEAKNYPGLIASGDSTHELRKAILDSILTYFDVPRAAARRFKDSLTLKLPDGTHVYPDPDPGIIVKLAWA
ncbi:MAG: hypothetical protein UV19_C0018G0005 [Parcubacteria group bacterium GW2011_GWA2_42_28]|nr:MAG: hypothetical protein UV19_C0018G0005 [Parcubacteria group bacterium GW2011_GWA2_42_28]